MPERGGFTFPPGPPTFDAGTIALRQLGRKHVELLIEASSDREITRWTRIPAHLDTESAEAMMGRFRRRADEGLGCQYVIAQTPTDPPVGLIGLALQDPADAWCADVFYWLLPEGRHRGLASRAVEALVSWAFRDTELRRAVLYTLEGNIPSERVAERCRFAFDRVVDDTREGRSLLLKRWTRERDVLDGARRP